MTLKATDIIDKKRLAQANSDDELAFMVNGVMDGSLPDYQVSAWLMAICLNGMTDAETTELTRLYVESGQKLDFSDIDGIVVDKHSTGGVGDKTTLIVAPMLAACGLKVAKLSGRGLGFTGGTVDKLEAIPGFNVELTMAQLKAQANQIGLALGTQTAELAPADGKIYALRDVTATVASIPLIAASVVSKKIAAGAQVITLDIKYGSGAFMKTLDDANQLATMCQLVGNHLGRSMATVITSMEQPLGQAIGHTTEVIEAIDTLKGQGPNDLTDVCNTLVGVSLVKAGKATSLEDGKAQAQASLDSGLALTKFRELISAQGGDATCIDTYDTLPQPRFKHVVSATHAGVVTQCDALAIAKCAKQLGAGREHKSSPIDLAVGIKVFKKLGQSVAVGEALAELWTQEPQGSALLNEVSAKLHAALVVEEATTTTPIPPLVASIHLD